MDNPLTITSPNGEFLIYNIFRYTQYLGGENQNSGIFLKKLFKIFLHV